MSGENVSMAALTSSTLFFETWAVPTRMTRSDTRSITGRATPRGQDKARGASPRPGLARRSRRLADVDGAVADELEDHFEVLRRLLVDREHERHDLPHAQRVDEVVRKLRERLLVVVHGQGVHGVEEEDRALGARLLQPGLDLEHDVLEHRRRL